MIRQIPVYLDPGYRGNIGKLAVKRGRKEVWNAYSVAPDDDRPTFYSRPDGIRGPGHNILHADLLEWLRSTAVIEQDLVALRVEPRIRSSRAVQRAYHGPPESHAIIESIV